MGKRAISPASVKLNSNIGVKAISPKAAKTSAFVMEAAAAIEIGSGLIAVAHDKNAKGLIHLTGYQKTHKATIIRYNK